MWRWKLTPRERNWGHPKRKAHADFVGETYEGLSGVNFRGGVLITPLAPMGFSRFEVDPPQSPEGR